MSSGSKELRLTWYLGHSIRTVQCRRNIFENEFSFVQTILDEMIPQINVSNSSTIPLTQSMVTQRPTIPGNLLSASQAVTIFCASFILNVRRFIFRPFLLLLSLLLKGGVMLWKLFYSKPIKPLLKTYPGQKKGTCLKSDRLLSILEYFFIWRDLSVHTFFLPFQ